MHLHSGYVAYSILFRKETKRKLNKIIRRTICMEQSHSYEASSHSAGQTSQGSMLYVEPIRSSHNVEKIAT
jgi:hypothetical protein